MKYSKVAVFAAAGVAAGGAAWVGASAYGAQAAERELTAMVTQASGRDGVRLLNLKHERGLMSSRGQVEVRLEDQCSGDPNEAVSLQVEYQMSHLVLPNSLMRAQWSLAPSGEAGADFARLFGVNTRLRGEASMALNGAVRSTLALPELTVSGPQSVQIAPSTGHVAWGQNTFAMGWNTERIVVRGNGQALELGQLAVEMDLKNRRVGAGTASFSVDKISATGGSAEGLRVDSEVVERGDRLDMKVRPSLRSASIAGQNARDLVLEFAVNGVHSASVETIGRVIGDTCALEHATDNELAQLRSALRTVLAQGFTAGLPRIAGTIGGGTLEGQVQLELKPTAGGVNAPILLAKVLRSQGSVTLKGDALSPDQAQMAQAMGIATAVPGGLNASYEYADGLLKANGRSFDAGAVQMALAELDQQLNAFLSAPPATAVASRSTPQVPSLPATIVENAPAEAPAPATAAPAAPAVPVTAAPTGDAQADTLAAQAAASPCAAVQACLGLALRAAAQEDVDTLRSVTSRIDLLAKPDLGNKTVARQRNAEGLAALKREDAAAAAEAFRRGLQENPRDVELAGNLGFALLRANLAHEAVTVLTQALVLDPRRSSTWTPLAEALALAGRKDDGLAALWVAYQWSGNRDKSLAYYAERAEKEREARPALAAMYGAMTTWITAGNRPVMVSLAPR